MALTSKDYKRARRDLQTVGVNSVLLRDNNRSYEAYSGQDQLDMGLHTIWVTVQQYVMEHVVAVPYSTVPRLRRSYIQSTIMT